MANDELIRKQDALDALMAERKHLLDKGQKGAEHILTHHGYNVIAELDVPEINVGDMISRQAAIDALKNRWKKTRNYEGIGDDIAEECELYLKQVPSAQPEREKGRWLNINESEKWECSECSRIMWFSPRLGVKPSDYRFCPNCGADMRGEQDE